jgi:hypothetical protein
MPRPATNDPEALDRALRDVRDARSAAQLRAAQAVVLPACLGMSTEETAQALGRTPTWVSRTRNDYIRGKATFSDEQGGRRRQLLSPPEELELVRRAVASAGKPGRRSTVRQEVKRLLQERVPQGQAPSERAITGILSRTAPVLLAGASPAELETWNRLLTRFWRRRA